MVGPFNSSVAKAQIPITKLAPLAQISPANTNPCLTKDTAESGVQRSKQFASDPASNGQGQLLPYRDDR